jgi:hypothetical protein
MANCDFVVATLYPHHSGWRGDIEAGNKQILKTQKSQPNEYFFLSS